jgi:hypothetical protein
MFILNSFKPWLLNSPRRVPEDSFGIFFVFITKWTKWCQEAPEALEMRSKAIRALWFTMQKGKSSSPLRNQMFFQAQKAILAQSGEGELQNALILTGQNGPRVIKREEELALSLQKK